MSTARGKLSAEESAQCPVTESAFLAGSHLAPTAHIQKLTVE
jgi:hypothetical protein